MRRVLVLGSGFTSAPVIEYLTRQPDISVTVASNILSQAEQLAKIYQNTSARHLDVHSEEELASLVKENELVISYVPYSMHPLIARQCLRARTNMVTASYVSPEMKALHIQAQEQGVILLNEVGLDPGIDHMLAMQCFDEVHSKGGKIISFESWCGGLPHPQYSNVPLKYKFSWSPGGVLQACKNSAKLISGGKLVEIAEGSLMEPENVTSFSPSECPQPNMKFEGYYNRDSIKYRDIYSIPEAKTIIRGTYRYKGFCKTLRAMLKLGLLDSSQLDKLQTGSTELTWRSLLANLTGISEDGLRSKVLEVAGGDAEILKTLEELGLLSECAVECHGNVFDALCARLQKVLIYKDGEKDAIYLNHFVQIHWPDNKVERRHINLIMYGTFGTAGKFTAMAQAVGQPTAMAARMILSELLWKDWFKPEVDIWNGGQQSYPSTWLHEDGFVLECFATVCYVHPGTIILMMSEQHTTKCNNCHGCTTYAVNHTVMFHYLL